MAHGADSHKDLEFIILHFCAYNKRVKMDLVATSSSSPLVSLQKELRLIEENNPWLSVQIIQEVDCPIHFPYNGCKGCVVQILVTGTDSHKHLDTPLNGTTDCNHLRFQDDSSVLRVELLFLNHQFEILCITHASSPPLSYVDGDGKLEENRELLSQMVSLNRESDTQVKSSNLLKLMTALRQSLQRPLPFLIAHACLHRYHIPVELRALIVNNMRNTVLSDSSIRHAVRLWTTNRDIAMSHLGHISTWNTSQVTSMKDLFQDKRDFNDDITGWDVRNVTNMMGMFANATSFNQPIDCWQIKKVRNVRFMFRGATSFNQMLPSWRKHVEMHYCEGEYMFDYGTSWDVLGRRSPTDYHPQYIILYEPSNAMVQVRLMSITGRNQYLPFRRCDSIAFVKQRLAEVVDIPANDIRLVHFGKQVEDYVTIDEASIDTGSRVDWVVKTRKTMFDMFSVIVEDSLLHLLLKLE